MSTLTILRTHLAIGRSSAISNIFHNLPLGNLENSGSFEMLPIVIFRGVCRQIGMPIAPFFPEREA